MMGGTVSTLTAVIPLAVSICHQVQFIKKIISVIMVELIPISAAQPMQMQQQTGGLVDNHYRTKNFQTSKKLNTIPFLEWFANFTFVMDTVLDNNFKWLA